MRTCYQPVSGALRPKSELLLYRKESGRTPKGWKPVSESDIHLFSLSGGPIPRVDTMRVLGMFIE
ncbi:hypothetical protein HPB50_028921 [Hyalomma asiaticum]|nr:hypothetical protein HPB50_028921 [Hyalomma asiaticum]